MMTSHNNTKMERMESSRNSKSSKTAKSRSDSAVQGTNDSSIVSKLSAAQHGYFSDNYLQYFVSKSSRRAPLINRGYYIRSTAVSHVIEHFLQTYRKQHNQIVSLGAGFDSAYFRLQGEGKLGELSVFCEVDFPDLVQRKAALIKQTEATSRLIQASQFEASTRHPVVIDSKCYKLLGVDLTNLSLLTETLDKIGLHRTAPTLFLSEVVLTYISPEKSSNIIGWAADTFPNSVFLTYEQIIPNDAFGRVMTNHFKTLGSSLKCIDTFPSAASQVERYQKLGWPHTLAVDMNFFFHEILPPEERQRVEALEPFDEFEEWYLKCAHYVTLTAFKGECCTLKDVVWRHESVEGSVVGQFVVRSLECTSDSSPSSELVRDKSPTTINAETCVQVPCSKEIKVKVTRVGLSVDGDATKRFASRRFGHCLSKMSGSCAMLTGGFGENESGKHCRMKDILCLEQKGANNFVFRQLPISNEENVNLLERSYHSCTIIGVNQAVTFGGRTSPLKPLTDLCLLDISKPGNHSVIENERDEETIEQESLQSNTLEDSTCRVVPIQTRNDGPCARWRHTAVLLELPGKPPVLVIYGGRNHELSTLDDCWSLEMQEWQWKKIQGREVNGGQDSCPRRHSHTADIWREHMVVACGLGDEGKPLNSVWLLDVAGQRWNELQTRGWLLPRFSHTSMINQDRLVLVGGVSVYARQPAVTVLDLTSGVWTDYELPASDPERPLMLHNHAMTPISDSCLLVTGGGGNCFSFGTHLNPLPVMIEINK